MNYRIDKIITSWIRLHIILTGLFFKAVWEVIGKAMVITFSVVFGLLLLRVIGEFANTNYIHDKMPENVVGLYLTYIIIGVGMVVLFAVTVAIIIVSISGVVCLSIFLYDKCTDIMDKYREYKNQLEEK